MSRITAWMVLPGAGVGRVSQAQAPGQGDSRHRCGIRRSGRTCDRRKDRLWVALACNPVCDTSAVPVDRPPTGYLRQ